MIRLPSVAALLALVAVTGCMNVHRATSPQSLREAHRSGGALIVDTRNGDVHVAVDPATSDVVIDALRMGGGATDAEAQLRAEQVRVVTERDATGRLCVRAEYPGGYQNGDGCAFTIRMPDVNGLEIRTDNGDVRLEACGGDAHVSTSNGKVVVIGQGGAVEARSSNGDVEIDGASGPVRLDTSNGGVRVARVAASVEASSSNGSIALEPAPDYRQPFRLETSNGSIRVHLSGAASATVHASTSSGRIDARSAHRPMQLSGSGDSRVVAIGDGGSPECHATTSNGDIDIAVD